MRQLYLNRAIAEAVAQEMKRDERVVLIGEDIINRGGGMSTFLGVYDQFPDRCLDMPIAESGFTHFGNGAALAGMRPIVDLMFSDFSALAFDAIVNGAAKFRFNSQGEACVPIVYVMANGGRGAYTGGVGSGCNHSQCVEGWFQNIPGLKIVAPYYPSDALGLLKASIRDDDPVLFLYAEGSLGVREAVPEEMEPIPLHHAAKIMREGTDLTIVAVQAMVPTALKAVEELEKAGISAELIDPRVLIPLDLEKITASVRKTRRLLVVHEAPSRGGIGAEILSAVTQEALRDMKAARVLGAKNIRGLRFCGIPHYPPGRRRCPGGPGSHRPIGTLSRTERSMYEKRCIGRNPGPGSGPCGCRPDLRADFGGFGSGCY